MRTRGLVILLCLALVSGCTQLQTVPAHDVTVGDTVRLVTKSDTHHHFKVTDISDAEIFGDGQQIRINDIKSVQKEELAPAGEQPWLPAAIGAVLGLIISLSVFSGSL